MAKIVYATRLIPLVVQYGQVQLQKLDIMEFLRQVNLSIEKLSEELLSKVGNRKILSLNMSFTQVNVGNVIGLLIVMYALVEDS